LNGETYAGGSLDAFLIKYASDGTVTWTRLAGSNGEDIGYGVQVDSSDNVFVCGSTDGLMSGPGNANAGLDDIFVIKYTSSGTKQWTKMFGGTGDDIARGLVLDSFNNIFITGYTKSPTLGTKTNNGMNYIFLVNYNSGNIYT
jgi:hypothetical protein